MFLGIQLTYAPSAGFTCSICFLIVIIYFLITAETRYKTNMYFSINHKSIKDDSLSNGFFMEFPFLGFVIFVSCFLDIFWRVFFAISHLIFLLVCENCMLSFFTCSPIVYKYFSVACHKFEFVVVGGVFTCGEEQG